MTELLNSVVQALKDTASFTAVNFREDSAAALLGREPLAAVSYEGMETVRDGKACVEEHQINVYVKLLSIGAMNSLPLKSAYAALELMDAYSLDCSVDSTDSRSVTYVIESVFRRGSA